MSHPPPVTRPGLARLAAAAAAATLALALSPAQASADDELHFMPLPAQGASTLSRAEVREALRQARLDGTLAPNGEAGDTEQVLAAREAANQRMAERIVAQQAQEVQAQMAGSPDGVVAEVVPLSEPAAATTGSEALVIITVPGDDLAALAAAADMRAWLIATGMPRDHIFVEGRAAG